MSVDIAWKQNILVTDSYLLKLLLVVLGFGLQAFVCDFSRQNICSVIELNEDKRRSCIRRQALKNKNIEVKVKIMKILLTVFV